MRRAVERQGLRDHRLPSQTGGRIGFGKACLVEVVYLVIGAVVAMIIGLLMMMLFGAAVWGMH
ncbi:hypothetical protein AB7872_02815 [Rhodanobacter denitrificans]|uniref:hypothetical protein n=1 Tax=Rhodanobacter sp. FW106-PBR-LB-1-21 TaxID=3454842 RepID=UPI00091534E9